jgi:PmbA protein
VGRTSEYVRFLWEVSRVEQALLSSGSRVVASSLTGGVSQAEAYLETRRTLQIVLEKGLVKMASEKTDAGCGVRVALGSRIGVSYVTSLSDKDLDRAAEDAKSAAGVSIPDQGFNSFTSCNQPYPQVSSLLDKDIEHLQPEQAAGLLMRGVRASREVSGTERNLIEGNIEVSLVAKAVVNSLGIEGAFTATELKLSLYSSIGVGDDMCSSGETQRSRHLADIDPEDLGAKCARNALRLRGAKVMEGGEMPLILAPQALERVLGEGLTGALDARQIQDGKSYLIDALGAEIASPELEMRDDGLVAGALGSRPFDAEGTPSQSTDLISSGVLRNYLHDSYTCAKDGVRSTGNAWRRSYEVPPRIGPSNLIVRPGTRNLDDLISEISRGVLCTDTFDRPNPVTGELSAMVMEGFLITGGEISHAVKNTLFGITMHDLLKRTVAVGNDVEHRGSVISPSILIESATITSG